MSDDMSWGEEVAALAVNISNREGSKEKVSNLIDSRSKRRYSRFKMATKTMVAVVVCEKLDQLFTLVV